MGMFQRKVSFYKLSLEKDFFIDNHKRARSTTLSNAEMEEQFTFIYSEKMSDISNGRKAIEIETYNSRYVVEVIDYSNHRAFLKIGQQNSANTVALRDKKRWRQKAFLCGHHNYWSFSHFAYWILRQES